MSALPNSTGSLAGLNTGVFVQEDSRGWEQAQRQYEAYRGRTAALRPEQLALGLTLLELRKKTPSGLWGARLKEYGIATHTSKRAIKAAGAHLGIGRELMAEILCCSLAKLKAYGLPPAGSKSKQQPDTMGQVSHSPELDVGVEDEVEDESQYAGAEELAALGVEESGQSTPIGGADSGQPEKALLVGDDGVERGRLLVAGPQRGTVVAAPRLAPQGVAGRIGPGELPAGRRPEAAGQLTLLSAWMELERDVERFEDPGKAERARLIVTDGLADIRRRLADLDRAA